MDLDMELIDSDEQDLRPWEYTDDSIYYDDQVENEEHFSQMYEYCVKPSLTVTFPYVWKLFLFNIIYRILVSVFTLPRQLYCIISTLCGAALMYIMIAKSFPYVIHFILFCFITFYIFRRLFRTHAPYILSFVYLSYLVASEFYYFDPDIWLETRGIHMVITMKFISLLFDMNCAGIKPMPNILEIIGYICCPTTCILGPWISFDVHRSFFENRMKLLDLTWLKHCLLALFLSLLFMTVSNCWATWIFPKTFIWMVAYQEALAFRSSSYFISYLSQSVLLLAGYGQKHVNFHDNCAVSKPYYIEFPRSLVQVVIYWNMPIHLWLKTYVFRVCKPYGSFFAIIMTYLVSSFLHGCNLRLAAVLLSLGFYTYVEFKFRNLLSHIFDACIKANPCRKCSHKHKTDVYTRCANMCFGLLAMFHLAYLGCLMETELYDTGLTRSIPDTFTKWNGLGYASHVVTGITYLIYKVA